MKESRQRLIFPSRKQNPGALEFKKYIFAQILFDVINFDFFYLFGCVFYFYKQRDKRKKKYRYNI